MTGWHHAHDARLPGWDARGPAGAGGEGPVALSGTGGAPGRGWARTGRDPGAAQAGSPPQVWLQCKGWTGWWGAGSFGVGEGLAQGVGVFGGTVGGWVEGGEVLAGCCLRAMGDLGEGQQQARVWGTHSPGPFCKAPPGQGHRPDKPCEEDMVLGTSGLSRCWTCRGAGQAGSEWAPGLPHRLTTAQGSFPTGACLHLGPHVSTEGLPVRQDAWSVLDPPQDSVPPAASPGRPAALGARPAGGRARAGLQ